MYKNPNYCELTVLYWIWKNCLKLNADTINTDTDVGNNNLDLNADAGVRYYGLFHYRRWLDINDADIHHLVKNDIDVILPYPTIHEPDIREHHARYIKKTDWEAVLQALNELEPEYYQAYDQIFSQEYLYNYNILIAKAEVLKSYYFMYHRDRLNIVHTGRIMLT